MNKQQKIKLYAKALAEVLSEKNINEKVVIKNFLKLLTNVGYESRVKEILNLAEDLLLEKQGKRKIIFETARKITPGQKKTLDSFTKKGDVIKETINPELIAGIKIIINNTKQFDASMKSKLQKIF